LPPSPLPQRTRGWWIALPLVAGMLLLGLYLGSGGQPQPEPQPAAPIESAQPRASAVKIEEEPIAMIEEAPVEPAKPRGTPDRKISKPVPELPLVRPDRFAELRGDLAELERRADGSLFDRVQETIAAEAKKLPASERRSIELHLANAARVQSTEELRTAFEALLRAQPDGAPSAAQTP
jgi:hypothetical protein